MRRSDREVTDPEVIDQIIRSCSICRIGLNDHGRVFIVPLTPGYDHSNDQRVFYFHGASAGRRMELIKDGCQAGFELDTGYEVHPEEPACRTSASYQSVMGSGMICPVSDAAEKKRGMTLILQQSAGKKEWQLQDRDLANVTILKLEVEELSCKVHK